MSKRIILWIGCGVLGGVIGFLLNGALRDADRSQNRLNPPPSEGSLTAISKSRHSKESHAATTVAAKIREADEHSSTLKPETQLVRLLQAFASGRMSAEEFGFELQRLGASNGIAVADLVFGNIELMNSNKAAVAAFVEGWSRSNPSVALDFFRSSYGADLSEGDRKLVKSLFAGLMQADKDRYVGLRSEISTNLESNLMAAWGLQVVRDEGFSEAMNRIIPAAKEGDKILEQRVIPHMVYLAVEAGLTPALAVAKYAETDADFAFKFGSTFGQKYPKEALDWATSMDPSSEVKSGALNSVIAGVGMQDPDIALDFAEGFNGNDKERLALLLGLKGAFASTGKTEWVEQVDGLLYDMQAPGYENR